MMGLETGLLKAVDKGKVIDISKIEDTIYEKYLVFVKIDGETVYREEFDDPDDAAAVMNFQFSL